MFKRLAERFADVTVAAVRAAVSAIHCALGAPALVHLLGAAAFVTPRLTAWIFGRALLIGILVLAKFPSSADWAIGLLVGIDLIFAGWTLISVALVGKDLARGPA